MTSYDDEEREIIEAFEAGRLKSTQPSRDELARHQSYAARTISKNKRVNIRLSEKDLEDIKVRAIEEGIPYQTLMGSILHKYIAGKLVEKTGS